MELAFKSSKWKEYKLKTLLSKQREKTHCRICKLDITLVIMNKIDLIQDKQGKLQQKEYELEQLCLKMLSILIFPSDDMGTENNTRLNTLSLIVKIYDGCCSFTCREFI
jgi:hypothetical protein